MHGRTRLVITAGMGLLLGAAGHQLSASRRGTITDSEAVMPESQRVTADGAAKPTVRSRPSLETVLAAEGFAQRVCVVDYLDGASLDEVLGLAESLHQTTTENLWRHLSMIYQRGLELDGAAFVQGMKPHMKSKYQLSSIFNEWVKIDPEAALKASNGEDKYVREGVIANLSNTDPERALALLESENLGSRHTRARIEATRMRQWLENDVQGALDHAMALPNTGARGKTLAMVLEGWAKKDADAALTWLNGQEDLPNHMGLLEIVLPKLAETGAGRARALLASMPESRRKGMLEGLVIQGLARENVDAALQAVREQPEGPYRSYLFDRLVGGKEPENLLELLGDLKIDIAASDKFASLDLSTSRGGYGIGGSSGRLRQAVDRALARMAGESPNEALSKAHEIYGQGHQFRSAVEKISKQWEGKDPAAAAQWAMSLPSGSVALSVQRQTFGNWARSAPDEAAQFLVEEDLLASTNGNLVSDVAKAWAERAPEALLGWAEALPDASRERLLPEALKRVADHLPLVAVEKLEVLDLPEQRQGVIQSIGRSWGKQAPQEAIAWMQDQPAEVDLKRPVKDAAKAWVLSEPLGASEWIGALEASPRRDHAVAGMVHALVSTDNPQRDFDAASAWVETIADESLRKDWVAEIEKRRGKEPAPPPPTPSLSIESIEVGVGL